jgi:hypothetical protein
MHTFVPNYRYVIETYTLMWFILDFLNIEVIDLTLKNDLQYLCMFILKYMVHVFGIFARNYVYKLPKK